METLIKDGRIASDSWRLLSADVEVRLLDVAVASDLIVPLVLWQRRREHLLARGGRLGLKLSPEDALESVVPDLAHFALVAIEFPVFTDGRGYSTARLLRERYGYAGELRAVGDVLRDQLLYLSRCGFNAFALRADQDAIESLSAFDELTVHYQGDARDPRPLFRRRAGLSA